MFSKADTLFSEDGILSQLEKDPLQPMEEDVSYDFLNLPNNLVESKTDLDVSSHKAGEKKSLPTGNPFPVALTRVTQLPLLDKEIQNNNFVPMPRPTSSLPNTPLSSPPQVVPKTVTKSTSPNNSSRVVLQPANYVLQQPQQYRNIQPNPTPQTASIKTVKPLPPSQKKSPKTGANVVTVQSMGQIQVPADQIKQVNTQSLLKVVCFT